MRMTLAAVMVLGGVAAAQAQSFDILNLIPDTGGRHGYMAREAVGAVVAHGRQAAAAERAREAAARERERQYYLSQTKAGRRQLAQERAEARRQAERNRRAVNSIVNAVGRSMTEPSGGGYDGSGRSFNEAASAVSACRGGGGSNCTSQ